MSAIDFLAGCFGGAAGVLIGHPLDTVKVKLQTQGMIRNIHGSSNASPSSPPKSIVYRGTLHCLMSTYQQEKFKGLYRGLSSPLYGLTFINAIVFGVYGNAIRVLGDEHNLKHEFLAGSIAGVAQTLITSPMELIKSRRQVSPLSSSGVPSCESSTTSLRSLIKERTLFKGFWATVARDGPAFGVYFSTYQYLLDALEGKTFSVMVNHLVAGGVAGSASWVVCYPVDVVKTRIQVFPEKFGSIKQCIKLSIQQEGCGFLTRGLAPTVIRAFPVNAVTFSVVSYTLMTWEKMYQCK